MYAHYSYSYLGVLSSVLILAGLLVIIGAAVFHIAVRPILGWLRQRRQPREEASRFRTASDASPWQSRALGLTLFAGAISVVLGMLLHGFSSR